MFFAMITSLPFGCLLSVTTAQQSPFLNQVHGDTGHRSIAIIGSGIGGASAAWQLRQLGGEYSRQTTPVTVYEQHATIGGRVQSIKSSTDGVRGHFEAGASHFSPDDWCIMDSLDQVGLRASGSYFSPSDGLPQRTNLTCDFKSPSWTTLARLSWQYGRSPWYLHRAVVDTAQRWERFAMFNHFTDLQTGLEAAGLDREILQPTPDVLASFDVSEEFLADVVQPCIRARTYRDLAEVTGLASLVTLSGDPVQAKKGNAALLDRMLRLSYAEIRLNSRVLSIGPGTQRRYALEVQVQDGDGGLSLEQAEYGAVIIAAPLSRHGIDISEIAVSNRPSAAAWEEFHVTHFMTPSSLSPNRSILPFDVAVSDDKTSDRFRTDVITSSATHSMKILSARPSGNCNFGPCEPGDELDECDECDEENLYCIYSRDRLSDEDLQGLLARPGSSTQGLIEDHHVTWLHRQHWPVGFPVRDMARPLPVNDIQIAPQLFYLNAAEHIMSSMEMSCRMGSMIATKLHYDKSVL